MLFLTYWELDEQMSVLQRQQAAEKLTNLKLFPPENVNILRWDATPDGWGILVCEAENAEAINRAINIWRATGAGFFKVTKTSPAMPVKEVIASTAELLQTLSTTLG